jgi:hypothetical protein
LRALVQQAPQQAVDVDESRRLGQWASKQQLVLPRVLVCRKASLTATKTGSSDGENREVGIVELLKTASNWSSESTNPARNKMRPSYSFPLEGRKQRVRKAASLAHAGGVLIRGG